ncbi:unnamed protein product [Lymnaea stagnalis]|uniref:Transcription factor IIIC putative zinc-finger domain-containing protein n=1 Tax=Lymnaea stagnalis TaxID=6523 RepID=A0AAV2H5B7_LYMST
MDSEILSILEDSSTVINSTKALSWSHDNRAILCCAQKVLIINVVCNENPTTKKEFFRTVIHETPNILNLGEFSYTKDVLVLKPSIANLDEAGRQRLMTDPSLCEDFIYPNAMLNTFKQAKLASLCSDSQCTKNVLAALTYGHRVILYTETSGEWRNATDLSPTIKHGLMAVSEIQTRPPFTIGRNITLDDYTKFMYGMSTVVIEWSSGIYLQDGTQLLLLFLGTRYGHIHIWAFNGTPGNISDSFVYKATSSFRSEVTSLQWLSRSPKMGVLAAGFTNGALTEYVINVSNDGNVTMVEGYGDLTEDNLTISDMAWGKISEKITILVACKPYSLHVYALEGNGMGFVRSYNMDTGMPLTSISLCGPYGFTGSRDGFMHILQCTYNKSAVTDKLTLEISKVTSSSFEQTHEYPWTFLGAAMSSPSRLCLIGKRLHYSAKLMDMTKKYVNEQKVVIFCPFKLTLSSIKEVINYPESYFSLQHTLIYLRLHIQESVKIDKGCSDILEIYMYLDSCDNVRALQIMRDILKVLSYWSDIYKGLGEKISSLMNTASEVNERLLIKYIESSLNPLPASPNDKDLQVIKAMVDWLSYKSTRSSKVSQASNIPMLCQQVKSPACSICSSEFHLCDELSVQCTKGHVMNLCSLSFLPCQDPSMRTCEACGHPAVSEQWLCGVLLVKQRVMCTLCGGFLRQISE